MKVRLALLSVFDKTGLVEFARGLREFGIDLLSTGGTAKALREAGIPITEVSAHTGSPEIMDGRVKTLHPKIHGGILAVRDDPRHMREAEEQGIRPIDLVCVNLYPFEKVVAKPDVRMEEAIENIDIGGPAMVRSSAKNHRYVTIVTDPADYPRVLDEMSRREGQVGDMLRRELAVKAFAHTARYDASIASWLGSREGFPGLLTLQYDKIEDLRYGENPHQEAAWYRSPARTGSSIAHAKFHGGKELSYNNILDLDAAFELVKDLPPPAAAIIKHNNPCGAATGSSAVEAFSRALAGDPVSAYGGILALNVPFDAETAERATAKENFFEAVVAPAFAGEALRTLREKPKWGKNVRILEAGTDAAAGAPFAVRGIRDGLLYQAWDSEQVKEWTVAVGSLTPGQSADLLFAWAVCKHVKSNAIVIVRDGQVVGVGAGQMSRVDSAFLAVRKAGDRARGAVAASDAFFPFPDALEVLAEAGVAAVAHPAGSVRDAEVAAAAKKRGVALIVTGMRHFRH
ncbi:MAG TPA: bifunctional phosphoribosylaminoimidazolecarboxamide formyltransferase/IMP cyclohydrolase [Planctomycetota bacterium]|nr:bifunctional phosphoribosylaminoimidazolecarboxamide formyltransferase/IMP cyclohydrolase [Planctomycetota bacterium]